ncbi:MAG TPA: polyprenyl diphosphate synthase [Anaerolineales bacterium]|nr:polyprenyl diphosphate synthase [Anaerolineales bacterium]
MLPHESTPPQKRWRHISLLLDGNGRWAARRGQARSYGHTVGAINFLKLLPAFVRLHLDYLSVYVFSTENRERPGSEVAHIFAVIEEHLRAQTDWLNCLNIRLQVIGRLEQLPASLQEAIQAARQLTQTNSGMRLVLAINYGGRQELVDGIRRMAAEGVKPEQVDEAVVRHYLYDPSLPDPDLILRTADERHLSNWMVWQGAHSRFLPLKPLSPDLSEQDLVEAVRQSTPRTLLSAS